MEHVHRFNEVPSGEGNWFVILSLFLGFIHFKVAEHSFQYTGVSEHYFKTTYF